MLNRSYSANRSSSAKFWGGGGLAPVLTKQNESERLVISTSSLIGSHQPQGEHPSRKRASVTLRLSFLLWLATDMDSCVASNIRWRRQSAGGHTCRSGNGSGDLISAEMKQCFLRTVRQHGLLRATSRSGLPVERILLPIAHRCGINAMNS